jgi:hypothetical protein
VRLGQIPAPIGVLGGHGKIVVVLCIHVYVWGLWVNEEFQIVDMDIHSPQSSCVC